MTPRLSSYWVDIVTSIPATVVRPLIEGLRSAVVVREPAVRTLLPLQSLSFDEAVRRALADARPASPELPFVWLRRMPARLLRFGRDRLWPAVLTDRRSEFVLAPPHVVYDQLARIGGPQGWYFLDWAWRARGAIDRLAGGRARKR